MPTNPCAEPLWNQTRGVGSPVLLLHGLGASARYWDRVLDAAAPGRRLVAPDLLGFGRSPAPEAAPYDVACHLTALEQFVEDEIVVVGHSKGGILAAALAAARPSSVRALILVGVPAYPDEAAARSEIRTLGRLARLTVEGRPAARLLCHTMCRLRPAAVALAPLLVRDLPREVAADGVRHSWASYSRTLRNVVVGHRLAPDLAQVLAPITFVHGRGDRTAPPSHVQSLAAELSATRAGVTVQMVDGDHHLPLRRADLITHVVGDA